MARNPNAIDLCLATDVASDLGIASSDAVQRCVTAASRAIAGYCARAFEKATGLVEYPAGYGRPHLLLSRAPILGITSIYESDSLIDPADYEWITENAKAGIVLRKSCGWRVTGFLNGRVTEEVEIHEGQAGSQGIAVTYDAGYVTPGQVLLSLFTPSTLPEDVEQAAIMTATSLYRSLGIDPRVALESIGDWEVRYFNAVEMAETPIPPVAQGLLAPYIMLRAL